MNVAARLRVYPQLGRVSNLPTIATQTAAAVVVADVVLHPLDVLLVGSGLASAYVAGMFLNDAFDRRIDASERPDRPIPAGLIDAREVFGVGGGLLIFGVALLALTGVRRGHAAVGLAGALGLAATIVVYDAWHKRNPIGPVIMGLCRALVYLAVALALGGSVPLLAAVGALAMLSYVSGLSEIARSPRLPAHAAFTLGLVPFVLVIGCMRSSAPVLGFAFTFALAVVIVVAARRAQAGEPERATVLLLGGLSLVDATLLATAGHFVLAVLAALALPVTRRLQRFVRGT